MQIVDRKFVCIGLLHGKCLSSLNYDRSTNVSLKLHELCYSAEP